jgi:hypothetical protein
MQSITRPLPSSKSFHLDLLPIPTSTIDKVHICSSKSKLKLEEVLLMGKLEAFKGVHFQIEQLPERHGSGWSSLIRFVYPPSDDFLALLTDRESALGRYAITRVELALDFPAESERHAVELSHLIFLHLRKLYHGRKFTKPEVGQTREADRKRRPRGTFDEATYYFEDSKGSTPLKIYPRFAKFGDCGPICRVEWTIKGAPAIKKRLGILELFDLSWFKSFGLRDFFKRHFRVETIDFQKLGEYLFPDASDPPRALHLYLHRQSYFDPVLRHLPEDNSKLHDVLYCQPVVWKSVSQVRGFLMLRRQEAEDKAKQGKKLTPLKARFAGLTSGKLNSFFRPVVPE